MTRTDNCEKRHLCKDAHGRNHSEAGREGQQQLLRSKTRTLRDKKGRKGRRKRNVHKRLEERWDGVGSSVRTFQASGR